MLKILSYIFFALLVLFAVGYFLTISGGKPISADLSLVGKGKPSLVLAYQNYSPVGGEALNNLRKVRESYDDRMLFIVADLGTPQGEAFANRYTLIHGEAVFLLADGTPYSTTTIPSDEQELRRLLDIKINAAQ